MKKKYKIALVTYSLSSGGLERAVANASVMFHDLGCNVHIVLVDSEIHYPYGGTLHSFNVNQHSVAGKILQYQRIKQFLAKEKFDVVIDHRYRIKPVSEFFWQRYIFRNQTVINAVHSSNLRNYLSTENESHLKRIFGKRFFVCDSAGMTDQMQRLFPNLRSKTGYNTVFTEQTPENIAVDYPYILAVARMEESNVKQVDVMLECFAESHLPGKGFRFVILGDGPKKVEMESLTKNLGLKDFVVFKGFVDNPSAYYSKAFFTLLASKYEGFGIALLESLQMGTPVVSYNCPTGPSEIIENEQNGLLVENQNKKALVEAMNRMVSDEQLYQKLKLNAKKSAEKFSVENIEKQWLAILEEELMINGKI